MATETKRERFVRIAEARTNKILEMMQGGSNPHAALNSPIAQLVRALH